MSKKTDTAAAYVALVHAKKFAEAAATLSESVVLNVPQLPPIEGRGGVEMALRMASESGRGLELIGWSAPKETAEGTVLVGGKAPSGLLGIVATLLRKRVSVQLTLSFDEESVINKIDVLTS